MECWKPEEEQATSCPQHDVVIAWLLGENLQSDEELYSGERCGYLTSFDTH